MPNATHPEYVASGRGSRGSALGVERVEDGGVVLLDDAPLDLHARRDLAGLDGPVVLQDRPLLDGLPAVETRVELLDVPGDDPLHLLGGDDLRIGATGHAVTLGPRGDGVRIEGDERGAELALGAVHDHLAGERTDRLELALDV